MVNQLHQQETSPLWGKRKQVFFAKSKHMKIHAAAVNVLSHTFRQALLVYELCTTSTTALHQAALLTCFKTYS